MLLGESLHDMLAPSGKLFERLLLHLFSCWLVVLPSQHPLYQSGQTLCDWQNRLPFGMRSLCMSIYATASSACSRSCSHARQMGIDRPKSLDSLWVVGILLERIQFWCEFSYPRYLCENHRARFNLPGTAEGLLGSASHLRRHCGTHPAV